MLERARDLCRRNAWQNVHLFNQDASELTLPKQLDACIFSLSYATMLFRQAVLQRAWSQLRPGGCLVIMDAKVVRGKLGRLLTPFITLLMRLTVLGNPHTDSVEELRAVAGKVEVEEMQFGTYFICRAIKPVAQSLAL